MNAVTITAQGFEVDAILIAAALGLDPALLREKMRAGEVTSLCETGVDADAGRFRLTFRRAGRALRLTVDAEGRVLTRSTFDAPDRAARKSERSARKPGRPILDRVEMAHAQPTARSIGNRVGVPSRT